MLSRNIPVQTLAAALMILAVPFGSAGLTSAVGPALTPVPGPEPFCTDRLMLLATETLIAAGSTECLHELEVEMNAAASTNATWLYGSTPKTACTLLWWQSGSELLFFAAPCYRDGRSSDSSSDLPCNSLALVGQARRDICGPGDLTQPQAQQASQADILECLGPITATESSSEAKASPVEDCLNEVLNDPTVANVVECVNQILGPVDNDAAQANLITCPSVDELCPAPILDLDEMSVCGVPICERDCSTPEPCTGENQIGIEPDCQTIQLCSGDEVGVEPYCVNPPNVQFCDAPGTGIVVNDFEACLTVALCSSPQVGITVNDIGYCQDPITFCNPPELGVYPTCVDPNDYVCDDDEIGLRPLCIAQPVLCDPPEYGVEPTCIDPADYECDDGEVGVEPACADRPVPCAAEEGQPPEIGVEPDCMILCSDPEVGFEPNCKDPNTLMCDDPDELGVKPACIDPEELQCDDNEIGVQPTCITTPVLCDYPQVGVDPTCVDPLELLCPLPTVGVKPSCFDGVSLLIHVIGIVLGIVGDQDCRVGTVTYQDAAGDEWCASPEEIRQDMVPGTPYPTETDEAAASAVEANTALVELEEFDPEFFYPTASPSSAMSTTSSTPSCNEYRTTCNVLFIRGYDFGEYSGYGGFGPAFDFFEGHGYNVRSLDTYGRCLGGTDVPGTNDAGSHDRFYPKQHSAGTTCSPDGAHNKDTDIRHMSYHVGWWIYDTYDNEPVDVIAHSMGGLLIRYAIFMSGSGDPSWPTTKINVEDVVTVATPHKGIGGSSITTTRQLEQMDPDSSFMTTLRSEGQIPQGLTGTDWTLIGADEDGKVNQDTARGMPKAPHKIRYNQNCCGGWPDGGYDHDEYFLGDNEAETTTYYWKNAEGANVYDKNAPHSVKRMYWGTVAVTH